MVNSDLKRDYNVISKNSKGLATRLKNLNKHFKMFKTLFDEQNWVYKIKNIKVELMA